MLEGYLQGELWLEANQAPDFMCLEVNAAFESQTGLKQVAGKRISEVIPGIQDTNPELFELFKGVAATGQTETGAAGGEPGALVLYFCLPAASRAFGGGL